LHNQTQDKHPFKDVWKAEGNSTELNSTTGLMSSIRCLVTEVDKAAGIETVQPVLNYMIRQDATQAGTDFKDLGEEKSRLQQMKLTKCMLSKWEATDCRSPSITYTMITHRL
jgi:hypothetical protein